MSTEADPKIGAYYDIRRRIVHLDLAPGEEIDENRLAQRYQLSRTPVREILIRLAAQGLVVLRKNRSAHVAPLDLTMLQSVFEAGDYLERAILRLACLRRTDRNLVDIEGAMEDYEKAVASANPDAMVAANSAFHERIARAAHNRYLFDAYRPILVDHERIGQLWYARDPATSVSVNRSIIRQHRALVEALRAGDAARGETAAMEHADFCKDGVRALLSAGDGALREITLSPAPL